MEPKENLQYKSRGKTTEKNHKGDKKKIKKYKLYR